MKNTRNYRFSALMLMIIMLIGVLSISAADPSSPFTFRGPYSYDATDDASISFISNGQKISNLTDLDPNKNNTMIVSVPASDALPQDKTGKTLVKVPENVIITNEFAAACQGDGISCSYMSSTNQLVFRWTDEAKEGFTATLPIKTNIPASREDVSGNWVLVINNKNKVKVVAKPEVKPIDQVNRLLAVEATVLYDSVYRAGTDLPEWKITRHTGDWYTISYGSLYLNYGKNGNHISMTETPMYFRYETIGAGNQFVGYDDNGTKYFLNNKSNNISKGIQASTYDDQCVELYKELKATAGSSLVVFSVNGGSADSKLTPVMIEKGSSITLPEYKGTRNGYKFLGWATRSNLKTSEYTRIYQPGESFVVDTDDVAIYAAWSSVNPERSQFGIRMSGDIPDEPAQYGVDAYSKVHVYIEKTVINGNWVVDTNAAGQAIEGNHVVNQVTANLNILPTDDEIKIMYPDYDPETMYVHWYVLKYSGGMWKVDGVIVPRSHKVNVRYDANVATENKGKIKNIPASYKVDVGTTITIGTGTDGKKMNLPVYPEYIFEGWNTKADGSGDDYESNTMFTADEDITFYAQWTKIPTYMVTYESDDSSKVEYHAGDKVTLTEAEEKENCIFAGWFINGERFDGTEFIMPEENVDITSLYYGPIDVEIASDWNESKITYKGMYITLTAITSVKGDVNLDYAYQWQYKDQNGNWANVPDATQVTMTYELNEETSGRIWRVLVTDAWLHQD